ncbi:hypothetical protein [Brenneria nigrifluens]|uniref:hypothetical protein n=1 Tax=Brenneria nigrifluens TaxID=55210 RepID=UPI0003198952
MSGSSSISSDRPSNPQRVSQSPASVSSPLSRIQSAPYLSLPSSFDSSAAISVS